MRNEPNVRLGSLSVEAISRTNQRDWKRIASNPLSGSIQDYPGEECPKHKTIASQRRRRYPLLQLSQTEPTWFVCLNQ